MQIIILMLFGYLCGSYPSGKLYGLFFKGIDIQKHGSGNIGFANACRVLGPVLGIAVLISDVLKAVLPLSLASLYLGVDTTGLMYIGMSAMIGHAYPVWLKFKGGKSIATGLGVLFVISPLISLLAILVYIFIFSITLTSATSSVVGAWSLVLWAAVFNIHLIYFCLILAIFATFTHRANIRDMIQSYVK